MRIAILGQGYVGKEIAFAACKYGHHVVGFDTNKELTNSLNKSFANVENYQFTSEESDLKNQHIYIIAVPTPLDNNNLPDISYLIRASLLISKSAPAGALIINESTSFTGTLRNVVKKVIEDNCNLKYLFAAAPERIDPANINWTIKNIPRVIAGIDEESTTMAVNFYRTICDNVHVVSSPEVAETSKLFENTFRQVNIALVNELAQISERLEISAFEVIQAAATKPFGYMQFNPSLGVGGHCIPVDPVYLADHAEKLGVTAGLVRQANQLNRLMPLYIFQRLNKLAGGNFVGKKIVLIGISYKADVNDMRLSPAIDLWKELEKAGAEVFFHDEVISNFNRKSSISLVKNMFDFSVVLVAHSSLSINKVKDSAPIIFDCTGKINGVHTL